ncbi:FecR domain-containing protein [Chitinophaga filiformis]|uniref:FecR family protein n=1 Tax=Chitinophaga filiformis TaxID=104663 RepID=UPI001F402064|nr:FecR domain-containing protein [Chitinophaga filiformis]MCF6405240.1 FecR domain-containing protein [Chitinophaga filiformis]
MDNQEINKLLQRYIAGECTAEEERLVEAWYEQQRETSRADVSGLDIATAQEQIWGRLQQRPVRKISYLWKIAAAITILLGGGYLSYVLFFNNSITWKETFADHHQPVHLTLPDGSDVWLNAGSHLRYPAQFNGKERQIILVTGEARIHAAEDPQHPFIITAGSLQTRVLGTIFNVRSYKELPFVQVSVQEGKVAVTRSSGDDAGTVLLLPNERATLYANRQDIIKDTVDAASISGWTTDQLLFNNERLDMIAILLEHEYNVRISFADTTLPSYKVTAGFAATDSVREVLEALSLANNLSFRLQGNNIVFDKQ